METYLKKILVLALLLVLGTVLFASGESTTNNEAVVASASSVLGSFESSDLSSYNRGQRQIGYPYSSYSYYQRPSYYSGYQGWNGYGGYNNGYNNGGGWGGGYNSYNPYNSYYNRPYYNNYYSSGSGGYGVYPEPAGRGGYF